jgi:branched-chain amino acid transport system permease protein
VSAFVAFTLTGLVIGTAYAIAASGLVVAYATSNVFNIAHGATGMVMAFAFWELHSNRGIPTAVALVLTSSR